MTLFRSLSFRLALIYMALFIGSTGLLFGAYYLVSIDHPKQLVRDQVERETDALANIYIADGQRALLAELDRRDRTSAERRAFHVLVGPDGKPVAANLPSWPRELRDGWGRVEADIYQDGDEEDHYALVHDRIFQDGARLIIGRDIEDLDEREEGLEAAVAWVLALSLLLGIAGGLLMSRAIGHRIDLIGRAAHQVIDGDLGGRIPVRGSGDDFDRLAETLNLMLDRIELLFASVRRVSDSVAHELRTPLSRLQAEVAEIRNKDGVQSAKAFDRISAEAERLQTIFNALLRIARIESGRHMLERRPVHLALLLQDAVELYAPAADEKGLSLTHDLTSDPVIAGDPDLIFQGLTNLIDNAVKFTPAGGHVEVTLSEHARDIVIKVRDEGPGIAAADLPRVTERFYRAADMADVEGTGLGLSLTEAIAKAHGSTLTIRSEGGTTVEWRFRHEEVRG